MQKKKKGVSPPYIATWVITAILIIISLILIASIIGILQPHKQHAFANVELLRVSMNKACVEGHADLKGFALPQSVPPDFGGAVFEFPRIFISATGDPTYLLYYESFPPGEAVGWETYIEAGNRLIVNAKDLESTTINDAKLRLKDQIDQLKKAIQDYQLQEILFSNIVLYTPPKKEGFSEEVDSERSLEIIGDFGEWKSGGYGAFSSYRFYQFKNYQSLSRLNKTLIKYRSCGTGNLCLKTNEGVFAFPLDGCIDQSTKQSKIKYIQIVYDATDLPLSDKLKKALSGLFGAAEGIAGSVLSLLGVKKLSLLLGNLGLALEAKGAAEFGGAIFHLSLAYKNSDFYIASPCDVTGNIEIQKIEDCRADSTYGCKKMIKTKTFRLSDNGKEIIQDGDHYSCLDNIGEIDKTTQTEFVDNSEPVPCLRVSIKKNIKNNFCFTPNPLNPPNEGLYKDLKKTFPQFVNTLVFGELGVIPVTTSTKFYEVLRTKSILIKDKEVQSRAFAVQTTVFGGWKWTWPGNVLPVNP